MTLRPVLLAALIAAAQAGVSPPAFAQDDPAATQQLIERLRPTRGLRVQQQPADQQPAVSAPVAGGPGVTVPPAATPPAQTAVVKPMPGGAPPRETTAPPDAPAVSITVTFPSGSARLTREAEAALTPLGRALASADLAPYRFRIEGHTDSVGGVAENQLLSERRALAVREFLMQKFGIAAERLEAMGYGEQQLLVPTPDQVSEPRNRRVQVVNLDG